MINKDEFRKYAVKGQNISGSTFDQYVERVENMTRAVIEERPTNFREIDVFSRLIMDRIIFLGMQVEENIANVITAQLLFLESVDPKKDILLYVNSPGGSVYAGLGMYDTMQYPLSAISSESDYEITHACKEHNVGCIAMKAMCGGLLKNATLAFAGLRRFENVVPIWGIQRMEELEEFLELEANPPEWTDAIEAAIEQEKEALAGDFCRGCGYCLPCPQDIPIPMAARMHLLLKRAPAENFVTEQWQEKMQRIHLCKQCGACIERCPYELNTPEILAKAVEEYEAYLSQQAV